MGGGDGGRLASLFALIGANPQFGVGGTIGGRTSSRERLQVVGQLALALIRVRGQYGIDLSGQRGWRRFASEPRPPH